MSNILKGIQLNEADPRNFDSDVDYYAARNAPAKPRYRGTQSPGVNPDDEAYFREIFRKKREAAKKAEQDKEQGVAEGQEVDVNVVVGKLYDIIDHTENEIKNADHDRQVQYATVVRDRAVKALNMIKQGGNTPEAASAAFKYMQTGEQGVAEAEGMSRRGFLKGIGAGAALLAGFPLKALAAYNLSEEDDKTIMYSAMYVYFSMIEGATTKGPAAAIRSVMKDISGFLGQDIESIWINATISSLNKMYQTDRNKWLSFQQQLSSVDNGIILANKLEKIKDKIIYSMSSDERKYHMNRLGIKEQEIEEEKQRLDPKCWKGYKKQGTKMKGDTRVNNCVPVEEGGFDPDSYYNARSGGEYGRNLTTAGERSAHYDGKGDGTGTRGRPVKDKLKKSNLPADPFGRTTGKIPASAKPKSELDPFRDIDESLEYSKRQQIIRFLAKKMDWEVSYLELASDANLISWYKKVQAGKDPMKESQKEADYGDEYQSMVARVGQKAKAQDAKKSPEQRQADLERLAKRLNQPEKKSNILKGIGENLGTPYPSTYEEENKPFMKKGSYRITAMTSENKK